MRPAVSLAVGLTLLMLAPASFSEPQREAISSALSPEDAAKAFQDAVIGACIPAVSGGGVSALSAAVRGTLQKSSDAETRRQSNALPDETVWDVMPGKGVVTLHEKAGRCVVSVYGPAAMPTIMSVAQSLTGGQGFERLAAAPPPNGFGQSLYRTVNGKRVMILLAGSEPGMAGHKSRFSVVTATVFEAP